MLLLRMQKMKVNSSKLFFPFLISIFINLEICISGSYTLSQTASEQDVSRLVTEMYKDKSKAVVLFLQDHNIKYY